MSNGNNTPPGMVESGQQTLALLNLIASEETHTQRGLASRLGIALGLANALIKRAAHKGLIKIKEAPARRYAYYITPKGFRGKSRLVTEYLSTSLAFFVRHEQPTLIFSVLVARKGRNVCC